MFIPGITEIYIVRASSIPEYVREQYRIGELPFIALNMEPMDAMPGATAHSESQQTPEGFSEKTELSFNSGELPVSPMLDLAFIIVAADGTAYLIGSREPPFPKLKVRKDLSTPEEGKAGYSYTFEWAGPLIPIYLVYTSFPDIED